MVANNSTLVLNWGAPISPNGNIMFYTVRIFHYGNESKVDESNTTTTNYTGFDLSKTKSLTSIVILPNVLRILEPGVPYIVSIVPVNLAGAGNSSTTTHFTEELGEHMQN